MNIEKIWMSPDTAGQSRFALQTVLGTLGIAILAAVLTAAGTMFSMTGQWPLTGLSREAFLLILCIAVTVLVVAFAMKLGMRAAQNATIFFLTSDDRLFAIDARRLVCHGSSAWDIVSGMAEIQRFLRQLAEEPGVPAGADEVLKVYGLRENRTHYAVTCLIRHPNQSMVKRTFFPSKSCADAELLAWQLERRKSWENTLEPQENRNPLLILISVLVCAGFTAVCVLSHPAVARLPQDIYFPCLGADFAAFCCAVYFIIRQYRGE